MRREQRCSRGPASYGILLATENGRAVGRLGGAEGGDVDTGAAARDAVAKQSDTVVLVPDADMTEKSAITGLGITEMGKVYGRTAADFAADAVVLAAQDAGLDLHDIDGLLISSGVQQGVSLSLARDLGLRNLTRWRRWPSRAASQPPSPASSPMRRWCRAAARARPTGRGAAR
ncbi:MAG: hypothetical protein JWN20_434, partial [Jatrophihabitantaceae bacterium]|nr:hypothetical protein [Jatrophihabitantaceae bacterium]